MLGAGAVCDDVDDVASVAQALNPQTQALLLEMHAALTGEGQDTHPHKPPHTPPHKPLPSSPPPIPPTESLASHAHHAGMCMYVCMYV